MCRHSHLTTTALTLALAHIFSAMPAQAQTIVNATNSNNFVFVGLTRAPIGATLVNVQNPGTTPPDTINNYVCVRGSSTGSAATWYYVGSGLAGLFDDIEVRGLDGIDQMQIFNTNTNIGTDTCAGRTVWSAPTYVSHFVNLSGGTGIDVLYGGNVETSMWGGDGGDQMFGYDAGGAMSGDAQNDLMIGYATSEGYTGGSGDDCIEDVNGSYGSVDAGETGETNGDTWVGATCPGTTFEFRITSGTCTSEFPTISGC